MTDIVDKNKRSYIMRQVKSSKNKSTELKLISIFKELSIKGWRRGYKLKGKPDFVFLKEKTAVFVDGCFWHRHTCRQSIPQTNTDYWISKIRKNIKHDKEITQYLTNKNWNAIRIWECELKKKNRSTLIEKISLLIK